MNASILAIGTELTDGQIVNSNAASIAARLKLMGVRSSLHLTVPDDRQLILWALDECAKHSDWLFITGGLGPTTDDFTRNVVADWAGLYLEFHPASWERVQNRLNSRGIPIQEFQKQQCYFPTGAKVLTNAAGTASGFQFNTKNKEIFVLPGPPKEVEAIWRDHLGFWMVNNTRQVDKILTRSWNTIGKTESQIAALVNPIMKGSELEVGFRVHYPYVEVKISYPLSEVTIAQIRITQVEQALSSFTVTHDGDDIAELVAQKLEGKKSFGISDPVTGSVLLNRLAKPLKNKLADFRWSFSSESISQNQDINLFTRHIEGSTCEVGLIQNGQIHLTRIEAPMTSVNQLERRRQYFAEMALVFWYKNLV